MKNPRGYFLSGLSLIAALLFALMANGNPVMGAPHDQQELTMPPPLQITAIIEIPNAQFILAEQPVSILIDRGVSVPFRGLILTQPINNENKKIINCWNASVNKSASDLGLRSLSQMLLTTRVDALKATCQTNRLRGVNTRLDIGELV